MSVDKKLAFWKIYREDRVLIVEVCGAWDETIALSFVKQFKVRAMPLLEAPWATISCYQSWELATPEAILPIQEMARWMIDNGCVNGAYILGTSLLKKMQLEQMLPEENASYHRKKFGSIDAARRWLDQLGFLGDRVE